MTFPGFYLIGAGNMLGILAFIGALPDYAGIASLGLSCIGVGLVALGRDEFRKAWP